MMEQDVRKFKSVPQAQRFVTVQAAVSNLFSPGGRLVGVEHDQNLTVNAFAEWSRSVA